MTIPTEPLEVNLNPDEMTLDDLCLFEPDGFTANGFRDFLTRHTNWTRKQAGAITVAELKDVAEQLAAKLKEAAVPLAPAAP